MKLSAFSVYDEKAECFGHPFFVSAVGIATRYLQEWAKNEKSVIARHPQDFTLYQVGYWDDAAATFDTISPAKFIAKATDSILDTEEIQPTLIPVPEIKGEKN